MSATTLVLWCMCADEIFLYFYPHHLLKPHWPQVVGSETRFICMGVSTSLSCLHKSGQGKLHHPLHIIHVARCQGHLYYTILYTVYYTGSPTEGRLPIHSTLTPCPLSRPMTWFVSRGGLLYFPQLKIVFLLPGSPTVTSSMFSPCYR